MNVEAELAELGKRVAALEAGVKTDIPALKRDLRRVLSLQDDTLEQLEELNRRVAANELIATANARTTEQGFANVQAQFDNVQAQFSDVRAQIDAVDAKFSGQFAALRRDLPGMMAETMREVLNERRGK